MTRASAMCQRRASISPPRKAAMPTMANRRPKVFILAKIFSAGVSGACRFGRGCRSVHLCRPGGSHGVFAHIRVHSLTDGSGPVHPACGGARAVLFRLLAHHVGFRHVQRKPAGSDDSQNEPQDAARAPPRRRKRAASAFHCFLTMMSDRYSSGRSATASRFVRGSAPPLPDVRKT